MRHPSVTRYSRWARSERLYREALLRPEPDRARFLSHACRGDADLYAEVTALLEPDGQAVDETQTAAPQSGRFPAIALVVGTVAFVLFVVAVIAVLRYGDRTVEFEYETAREDGTPVVMRVRPHRARALAPGSAIVAFDGDRRITRLDAVYFQRFVRLDGSHTLTLDKGGIEERVTMHPSFGTSREQWLLCLSLLAAAMVSFIVAALIAIYRPEPWVSRVAFAAGITLGLFLVSQTRAFTMLWLPDPWRSLQLLVFPINPLHLAICYDFYTRFPPGVVVTPLWRAVRAVLYAAGLLLAVPGSLLNAVLLPFGRDAYVMARHQLVTFDRWLYGIELMMFPVAGVAMLAVAVRNYRAVSSPVDRRRLGWVVWGTAVGLTPFLAIELVRVVTTLLGIDVNLTPWTIPGNLATAAIPISFGYAIIKHQVFDITVVVRRGIKYLLAINALRALLLLPVAALAYGVFADRDQPIGQLLLDNSIYVYLIGAAFLSLRFRTQLTRWVDRRFFREAYDRERILLELIEGANKLESASEMSRLVSRDLESAFHPECLFIWYADGDELPLKLTYSSGGYIHRHEIGPESPFATLLAHHDGVIELPATGMTSVDRQWLEAAGVRLVVPMPGSDRRLFGVVMLGDKKSEEPYSASDRKLLLAMARQIGSARENIRLKRHVDRHSALDVTRPRREPQGALKECPQCGACYDDSSDTCTSDGTALERTLPVERTIDGKYRLDRKIGKGGMGTVYEATDLRLARNVAVKIMLGRSMGDHDGIRRFEREAQAAARLSHPNIVTVFDFGRSGAGGAFLVMELVRGETMRTALEQGGTIEGAVIAHWFEQVCSAVAAAHQHGIVHRDLKPENILIVSTAEGDQVKVLDFGLAAIAPSDSSRHDNLTHPGTVIGTPGYMAPEQLTGGDVDERSDVFAIGVMVAEAISGRPPFRGRTHDEILMAIISEPLRLDGVESELRELEAVLRRAVGKEPSDRFATVADFARELLPALRAYAPN